MTTLPSGKDAWQQLVLLIGASNEDQSKFYDNKINVAGARLLKVFKQMQDIMRNERKSILEKRKSSKK